jgi:hypothetical protein
MVGNFDWNRVAASIQAPSNATQMEVRLELAPGGQKAGGTVWFDEVVVIEVPAPAQVEPPKATITTVAGTGRAGFSGDGGPAAGATLNAPFGIALDGQGNIYIGDYINLRVRKIDTNGIITTVAGSAPPGALPPYDADNGIHCGENIPALQACLGGPISVDVDAQGNLYIADRNNHRFYKVDPSGILTTFAGTGTHHGDLETLDDGRPARETNTGHPYGIKVGPDGVYAST